MSRRRIRIQKTWKRKNNILLLLFNFLFLWFFSKNVKNGPKKGQNASEVADFPEFRKHLGAFVACFLSFLTSGNCKWFCLYLCILMSGDPRAMLPGLILSMVIHPEKKLKIKMYILWFFFKNVKNGPKRGQNASEVADFPEFRKTF